MNLVCVVLLMLVFLYVEKNNVVFRSRFTHENHTIIFQYLTNVEKFKILNPTIISITHWERQNETHFYVEYTEHLSQLPVVENYGRANYEIIQSGDDSQSLISQHYTCFYTDLLCFPTDSTLRITQISKFEVGYQEEITYNCPWILETFCFNEILHQRRLIISKLNDIFSKTMSPTENYGNLCKKATEKNELELIY